DLVEGANQFLEGVGFQLGAIVRTAVKETAEIFEGFLAVALVMNEGVNLEPQQLAFGVIVGAAPPIGPTAPAEGKAGHCVGGVLERPPSPSRAARTHVRRGAGKTFAVLLRGPQSTAGGQEIAEEVGESLVDPQQIGLHRRLEIGSAQV